MKIKNKNINSIILALNKIAELDINDINLSWDIALNVKATSEILTIYNQEKKKIINKYVAKDEKGNWKVIDGAYDFRGHESDVEKDLNNLDDIENEISITVIKMDKLEGLEIKPMTLVPLIGNILEK